MSKEELEDDYWTMRETDAINNSIENKKLKQQIADLEAKLAESEKENKELHTAINLSIPNQIAMKDEIERLHTCVDKRISELVKENEQLKQQLSEKETDLSLARNEIDTLKHNLKIAQEHDNVMCELYFNKCKEHQDKILFAVEQLEKVKGFVNNYYGEYSAIVVTNFIDNQIKQLTHQQEDKGE